MTNRAYELLLKGAISELPKDQQEKVEECRERIRALVLEYGPPGIAALGLVGLELEEMTD